MTWPSPAPLYQKEMRPSNCTVWSSVPVACVWQAVQRLQAKSCAGVLASEAQPAASNERAAAVTISEVGPRHWLSGDRWLMPWRRILVSTEGAPLDMPRPRASGGASRIPRGGGSTRQSLRLIAVLLRYGIPPIRPGHHALLVRPPVQLATPGRLASGCRGLGGRWRGRQWCCLRRSRRRIRHPDPGVGRRHPVTAELVASSRILDHAGRRRRGRRNRHRARRRGIHSRRVIGDRRVVVARGPVEDGRRHVDGDPKPEGYGWAMGERTWIGERTWMGERTWNGGTRHGRLWHGRP